MYVTVNIEEGMPYCDEAIKRLTFYINSRRKMGVRAMKVIHGFGSSGTGGKIRLRARAYLDRLQQRGEIRFYICGENLSIFDSDTRRALDLCPAIRQDHDLERHNNGVTLIVF